MKNKRAEKASSKKQSIVIVIGQAVGKVVNKFFQAGRDSIEMVIKNILDFITINRY